MRLIPIIATNSINNNFPLPLPQCIHQLEVFQCKSNSRWSFSCSLVKWDLPKSYWKHVIFRPKIHIVTWDTVENNKLCGLYSNNGDISLLYYDCKYTIENSSSPAPHCQYVTTNEIKETM